VAPVLPDAAPVRARLVVVVVLHLSITTYYRIFHFIFLQRYIRDGGAQNRFRTRESAVIAKNNYFGVFFLRIQKKGRFLQPLRIYNVCA
jgi:hypothetical protein